MKLGADLSNRVFEQSGALYFNGLVGLGFHYFH
jgi:hypothetical protein